MNRVEELMPDLDLHCGYRPVVQIGLNIVIYCAICGQGIEVEGCSVMNELDAMLKWNHKVRKKKTK